jgi:hypothetical protein
MMLITILRIFFDIRNDPQILVMTIRKSVK